MVETILQETLEELNTLKSKIYNTINDEDFTVEEIKQIPPEVLEYVLKKLRIWYEDIVEIEKHRYSTQ